MKKTRPKDPGKLSIRDIEKVAGPVKNWPGNCYAIACAIAKAGLVDGEAVYGHWIGTVHPKSMFYSRSRAGFCRHGWVQLSDGRVLDATRWVFENVAPYIYVGDPEDFVFVRCEVCGHLDDEHEHGFFRHCSVEGCDCCDYEEGERWPYDEGGNGLRATMLPLPPEPKAPWRGLKIEGEAVLKLEKLLGRSLTARFDPTEGDIAVGQEELLWIANLPYEMLEPVTTDVYRAVIAAGGKQFIPLDNRNRAQREGLKL